MSAPFRPPLQAVLLDRLYRMKRPGRIARKLYHHGHGSNRFMWWWWQDVMNFGDWIGPELFAARTGTLPIFAPVYARRSAWPVHITAGSILNYVRVPDVAVVWGSGILNRRNDFAPPREIRAVRGPLTRQRCLDQGHACPEVYGDPGLLLSDLYSERDAGPAAEIGIVPHFQDIETARTRFGHRDDVRIIDVRRPVGAVVADILGCRLILSSSMHGLIVAHAFGRHALHVEFDHAVPGDGTKFHDYFMALGLDAAPDPVRVGPDADLADLRRMALAQVRPEVEHLRGPLRDACPF